MLHSTNSYKNNKNLRQLFTYINVEIEYTLSKSLKYMPQKK